MVAADFYWSCQIGWIEKQQVPYATPDFLLRLVALTNFMRLSLRKAAHAAASSAPWQESGYVPVGACDFINFL